MPSKNNIKMLEFNFTKIRVFTKMRQNNLKVGNRNTWLVCNRWQYIDSEYVSGNSVFSNTTSGPFLTFSTLPRRHLTNYTVATTSPM